MKKVLGRKQVSRNADWLAAMQHIEELISQDEVDAFENAAVERIINATAGKSAAYAWSAGKDSIVLGKLCEKAGVKDCFFGHCELEFPEYLFWALENAPAGCEVINTGLNLEWLEKHPELLFVNDAKRLNIWYGLLQRRAFSIYFEEHGSDMLLVGHRAMDGNNCGKDYTIRKKSGETRYAPIADWPHEAVLGYIHYHGLALPPTYQWENGWVYGSTPWPIWGEPATAEDGFKLIFSLSPEVVRAAAEVIPAARTFLEGRAGK